MTNFWTAEETSIEILRKRAHKKLLDVVCHTIAAIKKEDERNIALDAALMYMTIDLGSTPRADIKMAIVERVNHLVETAAAK